VLSACQQDSTEGNQVHFANCVTDDRKRILTDLTIGRSVRRSRSSERTDRYRSSEYFHLNGFELVVLDEEVIVTFRDLITARGVPRGTTSPVSQSTFCCFNRLLVFRLIRLKLTFSLCDKTG